MDQLTPNGVFADVLGHKIHVFRTGDANKPKLVFLSGSGTAAPSYDFKILYSKLSDRYRIIVIEKFGYGYSDLFQIFSKVPLISIRWSITKEKH